MAKTRFHINNLYFNRKLVSMSSDIRLLGRDEWILLNKDHNEIDI